MQLFDAVAEFKQTEDKLCDLGLDEQTLTDTLEAARFPVEQKCINVAMVIRNLEVYSEASKAQEETMAARRKSADGRVKWLKDYLLTHMLAADITKIDSPCISLSIAKNPSAVVVDCENAIPDEYFKQPETPPPVLDKALIKKAIQDGYSVPGVHIKQSSRLVIK
jgi:hypothetical protein